MKKQVSNKRKLEMIEKALKEKYDEKEQAIMRFTVARANVRKVLSEIRQLQTYKKNLEDVVLAGTRLLGNQLSEELIDDLRNGL